MIDISIDNKSVKLPLDNMMDEAARYKILINSLVKGGIVLRDAARRNFQSAMPEASSHHSQDVNGKLYEGIYVKKDEGQGAVTVSLMKDYRLKWFEKGTKPRQTKGRKINYAKKVGRSFERIGKGHYTGKVTGKNFFASAKNSQMPLVDETIKQSIYKGLQDLQKK